MLLDLKRQVYADWFAHLERLPKLFADRDLIPARELLEDVTNIYGRFNLLASEPVNIVVTAFDAEIHQGTPLSEDEMKMILARHRGKITNAMRKDLGQRPISFPLETTQDVYGS